MALADFPRHPLTFGPSPIHPLDRLSDHLGGARVWAKREDVQLAASPSAATRPASSSTSCPTRSRRAPTRSCRSAGCRATTPGRWRRSPRTSA